MFPLRNKPIPRCFRKGFTLLEICLAIFIAVLIVLAAMPSLSGVLEERRAKNLFNQFNDLVRQAESRAITERRPYTLVWDDSGVFLAPLKPADPDEAAGLARVDFGIHQAPELQLTAALNDTEPHRWTFWPTGTCEPATVICHLADAPWTAVYDPLTLQPAYSSP